MSQCTEGTQELNRIVTIIYVSMQISVAIFISIIGAVHVRRCKIKEKMVEHEQTAIALNTGYKYILSYDVNVL